MGNGTGMTITTNTCPSCGDLFSDHHSNYQPVWSDAHDNIVCWWCATRKPITTWNVTFVGNYATVTTTVEARDENDAETLAANLLMDYYDLDVEHLANDVFTEQLDGVPA